MTLKRDASLASGESLQPPQPADRVAVYSFLVNVFLLGLNLVMATY
jgi:hypothetical protein